MLDLSRFTDALSNLFTSNVAEALQSTNINEIIGAAGLDLSALNGLSPDAVMDQLAQHGIDVGNLAPEQLQQLMDQLGIEFNVGDTVSSFLGGGPSGHR